MIWDTQIILKARDAGEAAINFLMFLWNKQGLGIWLRDTKERKWCRSMNAKFLTDKAYNLKEYGFKHKMSSQ